MQKLFCGSDRVSRVCLHQNFLLRRPRFQCLSNFPIIMKSHAHCAGLSLSVLSLRSARGSAAGRGEPVPSVGAHSGVIGLVEGDFCRYRLRCGSGGIVFYKMEERQFFRKPAAVRSGGFGQFNGAGTVFVRPLGTVFFRFFGAVFVRPFRLSSSFFSRSTCKPGSVRLQAPRSSICDCRCRQPLSYLGGF